MVLLYVCLYRTAANYRCLVQYKNFISTSAYNKLYSTVERLDTAWNNKFYFHILGAAAHSALYSVVIIAVP